MCGNLRWRGCDDIGDRHNGGGDDQCARGGCDRFRYDGQILRELPPSPPSGGDPDREPKQERGRDDGNGEPRDGRSDLPADEPERLQDREVPASASDREKQRVCESPNGKKR